MGLFSFLKKWFVKDEKVEIQAINSEADFENAFEITMILEGNDSLSLNRKDPGNWTGGKIGKGILKGTKFGIAASSYPNLDIKNLTLEQVKPIYKKVYWDGGNCSKFAWPLNVAIFDFGVQSSPARAKKYLGFYPDFETYLVARNTFLNKWADRNPGNNGVRFRVERLRGLINSYNTKKGA